MSPKLTVTSILGACRGAGEQAEYLRKLDHGEQGGRSSTEVQAAPSAQSPRDTNAQVPGLHLPHRPLDPAYLLLFALRVQRPFQG